MLPGISSPPLSMLWAELCLNWFAPTQGYPGFSTWMNHSWDLFPLHVLDIHFYRISKFLTLVIWNVLVKLCSCSHPSCHTAFLGLLFFLPPPHPITHWPSSWPLALNLALLQFLGPGRLLGFHFVIPDTQTGLLHNILEIWYPVSQLS